MNKIPVELLIDILEKLTSRQLGKVSRVNKQWKILAKIVLDKRIQNCKGLWRVVRNTCFGHRIKNFWIFKIYPPTLPLEKWMRHLDLFDLPIKSPVEEYLFAHKIVLFKGWQRRVPFSIMPSTEDNNQQEQE